MPLPSVGFSLPSALSLTVVSLVGGPGKKRAGPGRPEPTRWCCSDVVIAHQTIEVRGCLVVLGGDDCHVLGGGEVAVAVGAGHQL